LRRIIIILSILIIASIALSYKFPYILDNKDNYPSLIQSIVILSVLLFGLLNKNVSVKFILTNVLMWCSVGLVLITLYTYQYDLKTFANRILGSLNPSSSIENTDHSISFQASYNGHFLIDAKVNNKVIHFLLDTGASFTTLTRKSAELIGIDTSVLNYNIPISTANGRSFAASTMIDQLEIGHLKVKNIIVYIVQSGLDVSLLGMNFLNGLDKYEVSQGRLTLWGNHTHS